MGVGVKLLLDTCVFIWLTQEPARISLFAADALDDSANELFLSHASLWEIHLKCAAGKLQLPAAPREWIDQQLSRRGLVELPIDLKSLHGTSDLPPIHKDPFDRLLVAQALMHDLAIVTPDPLIQKYSAKFIW